MDLQIRDKFINLWEMYFNNAEIPKHVVFADALPYSPYGKVQKAELRKRYLNPEED